MNAPAQSIDRVWDQIGHDLGWNDHNMRTDRPYSGQPHTSAGGSMSLEYIRKTYGVPAKRGVRIEYGGGSDGPRFGTITGASGMHLMVKMDDRKDTAPFHPTWNIRYLTEAV